MVGEWEIYENKADRCLIEKSKSWIEFKHVFTSLRKANLEFEDPLIL